MCSIAISVAELFHHARAGILSSAVQCVSYVDQGALTMSDDGNPTGVHILRVVLAKNFCSWHYIQCCGVLIE